MPSELDAIRDRLIEAGRDHQAALQWDNEIPLSKTRLEWRTRAKTELAAAIQAHELCVWKLVFDALFAKTKMPYNDCVVATNNILKREVHDSVGGR